MQLQTKKTIRGTCGRAAVNSLETQRKLLMAGSCFACKKQMTTSVDDKETATWNERRLSLHILDSKNKQENSVKKDISHLDLRFRRAESWRLV